MREKLRAISIDGTSGTLLLSDGKGKPSSPVLMYNDTQAWQEAADIATIAPDQSGAHGVGGSLSKLLFLLKQYPHQRSCSCFTSSGLDCKSTPRSMGIQ